MPPDEQGQAGEIDAPGLQGDDLQAEMTELTGAELDADPVSEWEDVDLVAAYGLAKL